MRACPIILAMAFFLIGSAAASTVNIYTVFHAEQEQQSAFNQLYQLYPHLVSDMDNVRADAERFEDGAKLSPHNGFERHRLIINEARSDNLNLFRMTMASFSNFEAPFLSDNEHALWLKHFNRLYDLMEFVCLCEGNMIQLLRQTKWAAGSKTAELPYESGFNASFENEVAARSYRNMLVDILGAETEWQKIRKDIEGLAELSDRRLTESQSLMTDAWLAHPGFFGVTGLDFASLNALDEVYRPVVQIMVEFMKLQAPLNKGMAYLGDLHQLKSLDELHQAKAAAIETEKLTQRLEQDLPALWTAVDKALTKAKVPDKEALIRRLQADPSVKKSLAGLDRQSKALRIVATSMIKFCDLAEKNFKKWSAVSNTVAQSLTPPRNYRFDNTATDVTYSQILVELQQQLAELQK